MESWGKGTTPCHTFNPYMLLTPTATSTGLITETPLLKLNLPTCVSMQFYPDIT